MRNRSLLLATVLLSLLGAAFWVPTSRLPSGSHQDDALWSWIRSPAQEVTSAHPAASQDTLSEAAALRSIGDLSRLEAHLAEAQASGATQKIERILHAAIEKLDALVRRPGLSEHPRFRRLFRSLTSEYEARYGIPDTLGLPKGKIYELRSNLSDSFNKNEGDASLHEALPAGVQFQNSEVPFPLNRHVQESMAFLLEHKDKYLSRWLRRASTYFPIIEHILAEEGVPGELKYLAVVESGLDPQARSRAQAAGMWQFVSQTARLYDLSIDPWVDERLDREETGERPSFWDIYEELPRETRRYVPLFAAVAHIFSNPARYELNRVSSAPRYTFDYVPIGAPLKIERVARLAETELKKIRALNPELWADRLPPSKEPYYVRLPRGTHSTFASHYATVPEKERVQHVRHRLRAGETIGRAAKRYHVDRSRLLAVNGGGPPIRLRLGERLANPDRTYSRNARLIERIAGAPLRVHYGTQVTRQIGTNVPLSRSTSIGGSSGTP